MATTRPSAPLPSQAELAYREVSDLLVRLEIAPGTPINEGDLMERTGFGRTPLREALNRLEAERLVNIYPRRGTFAADIKLSDLALITDLREELEGHAAQRAAERATDEDRVALSKLAAVIGDAGDQMALDTEIHKAIYAAAHNHFLTETATQYYNLSMRIWRLFMDRLPEIAAHVDEHKALLRAIASGDAETARNLARTHVRGFESAVRKLL
jgi:DNA-binding GntR family transcriptional regulator